MEKSVRCTHILIKNQFNVKIHLECHRTLLSGTCISVAKQGYMFFRIIELEVIQVIILVFYFI